MIIVVDYSCTCVRGVCNVPTVNYEYPWSWFDNMIERIEDNEYQVAEEQDIKTLFY